jgi:hypothetical protein
MRQHTKREWEIVLPKFAVREILIAFEERMQIGDEN